MKIRHVFTAIILSLATAGWAPEPRLAGPSEEPLVCLEQRPVAVSASSVEGESCPPGAMCEKAVVNCSYGIESFCEIAEQCYACGWGS